MKKLISAGAALALTLSAALAAPLPAAGTYGFTVTINGAALDTSALPAAPAGEPSLPLRALAEADYGFADYYTDEGRSFFALDGNRIDVDCATGSIEVNGAAVEDMTAAFSQGVTFVPAALLNRLDGYTATVRGEALAVTTPNGDELVRLARTILAEADMAAGVKADLEEMERSYGIPADCFTEAVGFFPMMISADTVVIGKAAQGRLEAAREALEARRAATQQSFEQYLPGPLERAKNGRVVTSGGYVMLIISGDNDAAIRLFQEGVKD